MTVWYNNHGPVCLKSVLLLSTYNHLLSFSKLCYSLRSGLCLGDRKAAQGQLCKANPNMRWPQLVCLALVSQNVKWWEWALPIQCLAKLSQAVIYPAAALSGLALIWSAVLDRTERGHSDSWVKVCLLENVLILYIPHHGLNYTLSMEIQETKVGANSLNCCATKYYGHV